MAGLDLRAGERVLPAAVSDSAAVNAAMTEAVQRFGGLDAVVHTAGIDNVRTKELVTAQRAEEPPARRVHPARRRAVAAYHRRQPRRHLPRAARGIVDAVAARQGSRARDRLRGRCPGAGGAAKLQRLKGGARLGPLGGGGGRSARCPGQRDRARRHRHPDEPALSRLVRTLRRACSAGPREPPRRRWRPWPPSSSATSPLMSSARW